MLSSSAFNAFLKTLEEPPPYAIFILATTEKHKILPTILSRCQIFDFKRITTQDIVNHLQSIASKEGMVAQEAALHVIAQKSEGCMRDALSMLDRIASFTNGMLTYNGTMEHLNLLDADYYFELTDALLGQDVAAALLSLDKAMDKGFEGDVIVGGLAEHLRNLLLCKDARMAKLLDVPNDLKPTYVEKANQAPPSFILSGLNVVNQCELEYKNANNKRLHVEMCIIRLCFLLQAVKPSANADDVKKNFSGVGAAPASFAPAPIPAPNTAPAVNTTPAALVSEPQVEFTGPPTIPRPAPVAAAPAPQPVSAAPAPPAPKKEAPAARRLSKGLLDDMDSTSNVKRYDRQTPLTPDEVNDIFEAYKKQLRDAGKGVIHAQLSLMTVMALPPDEVRIISPSELTDTYAREQRTAMLDFYREQTNMLVRITTELKEDEAIKNAQANTVLSKSEIYEMMAIKNPNLHKLRDGLNMQLEY